MAGRTEGKGAAFPTPPPNAEHAITLGAVGCLLGGVFGVFGLKTNQGRLTF